MRFCCISILSNTLKQLRIFFYVLTPFIIILFLIVGVVLSVVESDPEVLIATARGLPRVVIFGLGVPIFLGLVVNIITLPDHIRFYKMIRYQEDYRGELVKALKHSVPCIADDSENAFIFTTDDWLVSIGQVAIKNKNYKKHELMETDVRTRHFSGQVYSVHVYFNNMPWEKASINPVRSNKSLVVPNAEVMKSIDKWLEKS